MLLGMLVVHVSSIHAAAAAVGGAGGHAAGQGLVGQIAVHGAGGLGVVELWGLRVGRLRGVVVLLLLLLLFGLSMGLQGMQLLFREGMIIDERSSIQVVVR